MNILDLSVIIIVTKWHWSCLKLASGLGAPHCIIMDPKDKDRQSTSRVILFIVRANATIFITLKKCELHERIPPVIVEVVLRLSRSFSSCWREVSGIRFLLRDPANVEKCVKTTTTSTSKEWSSLNSRKGRKVNHHHFPWIYQLLQRAVLFYDQVDALHLPEMWLRCWSAMRCPGEE